MSTEIRLTEGESIRVSDDYREGVRAAASGRLAEPRRVRAAPPGWRELDHGQPRLDRLPAPRLEPLYVADGLLDAGFVGAVGATVEDVVVLTQ